MDHREPTREQRRRFTDKDDDRRESVESRLSVLEEKVDRIAAVEIKLDANTALTQRSVEMWENMEAGMKVLGALGAFAKWLAPIIGVFAAIWALFHGGTPPTKG